MDAVITVAPPKYGRETGILPKKLVRGKGGFALSISLEFLAMCHFLHPARPLLIRRHSFRKMPWITRSSVDGNRFNPSSPIRNNSSGRPRLIKAIQSLRTKVMVRIEEVKKDLPMKVFFLLVGFYSATAFSTVIGQTGDWDVLSAALAVLVVEGIGALMYKASVPLINKIKSLIIMFNYWKTGLALGLFLDSFKYDADNNTIIHTLLLYTLMIPRVCLCIKNTSR